MTTIADSGCSNALTVSRAYIAACNAHDLQALRAVLADDFEN